MSCSAASAGEKSAGHPKRSRQPEPDRRTTTFTTAMHIAGACGDRAPARGPALAHPARRRWGSRRDERSFVPIVRSAAPTPGLRTPSPWAMDFPARRAGEAWYAAHAAPSKLLYPAAQGGTGGRAPAQCQPEFGKLFATRVAGSRAAVQLGAEQVRGARIKRCLRVRARRLDSVAAGLFKIATTSACSAPARARARAS
jgi:hypothetical protein